MQVTAWFTSLLREQDRLVATIQLAEHWRSGSRLEREAIVAGWSWGVHWAYPPAGRLACTVGETGTPLQRIRAALLLNFLEIHQEARQQAVFLCEVYNSCLFADLDPDRVFDKVANMLPSNAGEILLRFSRRSAADKALAAFGFIARRDNNGKMELVFA